MLNHTDKVTWVYLQKFCLTKILLACYVLVASRPSPWWQKTFHVVPCFQVLPHIVRYWLAMTLDSQPPLTQHAPLHNATFPAIEELSGTMWPYRKTNDKRLKQKNTERSGSGWITSYASRKKMEVTSSDQSSLKGHCTALGWVPPRVVSSRRPREWWP
jgi:hypothetical protein